MKQEELKVMNYICKEMGITTLSELEDFESETLKMSGDILKRLCFYYAFDYKHKGAK